MDKDHRAVFKIINDLYIANESMDRAGIEEFLSAMIAHSIAHFHREESYMRRIGYPDLPLHKELHDEFIDRVQALFAEFRKDKLARLPGEGMSYIAGWYGDHILIEDKRYADYLIDRGLV